MTTQILTKDKGKERDRVNIRRIRPFDWISLIALITILIIFIYAGYFTREYPVVVTKIEKVLPHEALTIFKTTGQVGIGHTISVGSRVAGHISEIVAEPGAYVRKEQVLARIEDTDAIIMRDQRDANLKLARASLEQAGIHLGEARNAYEQNLILFRKGSLSKDGLHAFEIQMHKAKAAFNVAEATVKANAVALKGAIVALGYTEIKAPCDGIVLECNARVGESVKPVTSEEGRGIFILGDMTSLQVEAAVPGAEAFEIRPGQPCMVYVEAAGVRLRGVVSTVASADETKPTPGVVVTFSEMDARIRSGMEASIAFLSDPVLSGEDKPLIMVRRSSLVPVRDGHAVYVARNNRAEIRNVVIGKNYKNQVQISAGLEVGDLLIEDHPDGMRTGSKLIVRNN